MCMGCHPDQHYLTNQEIITVVEPVYEKVDLDCDSDENKKDFGADCPRTRKNISRGTYRVEERDKYFVYVDE